MYPTRTPELYWAAAMSYEASHPCIPPSLSQPCPLGLLCQQWWNQVIINKVMRNFKNSQEKKEAWYSYLTKKSNNFLNLKYCWVLVHHSFRIGPITNGPIDRTENLKFINSFNKVYHILSDFISSQHPQHTNTSCNLLKPWHHSSQGFKDSWTFDSIGLQFVAFTTTLSPTTLQMTTVLGHCHRPRPRRLLILRLWTWPKQPSLEKEAAEKRLDIRGKYITKYIADVLNGHEKYVIWTLQTKSMSWCAYEMNTTCIRYVYAMCTIWQQTFLCILLNSPYLLISPSLLPPLRFSIHLCCPLWNRPSSPRNRTQDLSQATKQTWATYWPVIFKNR